MTFSNFARMRWPKAKIFSLYLRRCRDEDEYRAGICTGYVPPDLTDDEAFWRGCNGCVNHDILERTERKVLHLHGHAVRPGRSASCNESGRPVIRLKGLN